MSSFSSIHSNIPSLHLRKDIWTHFPVCLIKLPFAADCRDRYAVQWHKHNLKEWSQGIPQYPAITLIRLLKSLTACDKWSVEAPAAPGDLCVIAMNIPAAPKDVSGTLPAFRNALQNPELSVASIDELRRHLPVCWKSRNNRYTLEYHNTHVRALAAEFGLSELEVQNLTYHKLVAMLEDEWEIRPSNKVQSNEICTVVRRS